jgi:cytochrome c553
MVEKHSNPVALGSHAPRRRSGSAPDARREAGMTRIGFLQALAALMIVAGSTIAGPRDAAAQVTPITPAAKASDFKPLFVKPEDISEGKRLADASCSGCHGPNGISATEGVPNVAGQRSVYLYRELKAYQSGLRPNTIMTNSVKFLNDDALVKVSAYYAGLEPAQPLANAPPPKPDPVEAGKAAAASCGGCHGEKGVSKIPGMPNLAGLDPKYLINAMRAYKSGQRKQEIMKALIGKVPDAEFKNIALYFALQKAARAQTPSPGDQAKGKAASAACTGCHGDTGVSSTPANPSLAGQDTQYLTAAIHAYKDGTRTDDTMKGMVASLDDAIVKDIAAYYANQQPQQPNVRKPLTSAEWTQRCDRCHGIRGNSTDPSFPALAGQRADYLKMVLQDYRKGARKSPEMTAMAGILTEDDIENLAAYYAHQKARSAIYVVVPRQ